MHEGQEGVDKHPYNDNDVFSGPGLGCYVFEAEPNALIFSCHQECKQTSQVFLGFGTNRTTKSEASTLKRIPSIGNPKSLFADFHTWVAESSPKFSRISRLNLHGPPRTSTQNKPLLPHIFPTKSRRNNPVPPRTGVQNKRPSIQSTGVP